MFNTISVENFKSFKSLTVDNFKSFKSLTVDNLSQVNILFGKNNCGKSTFLESVFMLSGMTNPEMLFRCNGLRGFHRISEFSYFFHNLDCNSKIKITGESTNKVFNREMFIELDETKTVKSGDMNFNRFTASNQIDRSKLKITAKTGLGETYYPEVLLEVDKQKEQGEFKIPRNYKEDLKCTYSTPNNSLDSMYFLVANVVENKQKWLIVEALQNIDSRIKNVEIINGSILVDIGFRKMIPIQLLGDGVRKFFELTVFLYECRDGILLIDEIDNGLYFSVMKDLWRMLLTTAKKFNVQVFVTTHNIDSIKGLSKVLGGDQARFQESVSCYKLIHRDDDTMRTLYYPYKSFSTLIENENEIR